VHVSLEPSGGFAYAFSEHSGVADEDASGSGKHAGTH